MRRHIRSAALLFACAAPVNAEELTEIRDEMPGTVVSRPLTNKPTISTARYNEPAMLPAPAQGQTAPMTMPELIGPGTLAARQMIGTAPVMSGLGCPTCPPGCVPANGCTPGSPGCASPHEGTLGRVSRWMFYTNSGSYGYAPCERYPYTVPLYAYFPCRNSPRWVKGMYAGNTLAGCGTGGCINGGSTAPVAPLAPQPGLHPYPTQTSPLLMPMNPNLTDAKGAPRTPAALPVSAPKAGPPATLPPAIPSASNTKGTTAATAVGYRPVGGSGPVYQQNPMLSPAYYRLPPTTAPATTEATLRPTTAGGSYNPASTSGGSNKPTPGDR